mgnify:CR=1 FL=1|jgi:hypothetical protein
MLHQSRDLSILLILLGTREPSRAVFAENTEDAISPILVSTAKWILSNHSHLIESGVYIA